MDSRQEALSQISELIKKYSISISEIQEAIAPTPENKKKDGMGIAMMIFSLLGGIFIFSGVAVYASMFWEGMNSAARVIITLGSGIALYVMGIIFSRDKSKAAFVAPIMFVAALFETGGLFVLINEYFNYDTNNWRLASLLVFGIMLTQQLLTFISIRVPILLFTMFWFAGSFLFIAFDMLGVVEEWTMFIVGLSILLISHGMYKDAYRRIAQMLYVISIYVFYSGVLGIFYQLDYADYGTAIIGASLVSTVYGLRAHLYDNIIFISNIIGSLCFLWGGFEILQDSPFEIFYIGFLFLALYFSITIKSTSVLIISVLSTLGYIGYFTAKNFVNSVGWPISLIIIGIIFSAISAGAFKIKKKYIP
ncbi:MAG: DUF2157 domain-containing protein [Rickettsiales bacterium]